jgi:DNA-binding NarL/FixJ family response regulator
MDKQHINVLLIEDNADYADLIREILGHARDVTIDCRSVETLSSALQCLAEGQCDIVLSDLFLPDRGARDIHEAPHALPRYTGHRVDCARRHYPHDKGDARRRTGLSCEGTVRRGSAGPFDVVIMDLTVPGSMGGAAAIKKLLAIDPSVRAIVSSGYSNDPVMTDFKAYGFKGIMLKPYKIKELSETLRDVLSSAE